MTAGAAIASSSSAILPTGVSITGAAGATSGRGQHEGFGAGVRECRSVGAARWQAGTAPAAGSPGMLMHAIRVSPLNAVSTQ